MSLSDISVRRPVFAAVLSLLLVVLGTVSFGRLSVREFPDIDRPVVSIDTEYRGAAAAVVESRITQPLEDAVSGIEGIVLIRSSSEAGRSSISIEFELGRDIDGAANDVRDAVARARALLPTEAEAPRIAKAQADGEVIMWLGLASDRLSTLELTDYAERYIIDRLANVPGVARIQLGGAQRYAMRVWLDPVALAARGLTVNDVFAALRRENVELPAGRIESTTRDFQVRLLRPYGTPEDFAALPIARGADGHVTRLGEVARVELGAVERRSLFRGNGQGFLGLGVIKTSTANTVEVARGIRAEVSRIEQGLPPGMRFLPAFDSSVFIDTAIREVYKTLFIAIVLVIAVIWLFLGRLRAALIPALTVPICVVAAFSALDLFGFSINLLTLLALVLSIGLVVDDAIVVLENCQRRVDSGEPRLLAADRGARQVAFAVIATTAVLISVFVPIAFLEGDLGRLFRELAVTVSAAVAISSVVALSLAPMLCSKLLVPRVAEHGLARGMGSLFERVSRRYESFLASVIARPVWMAVALLATMGLSVWLYRAVPRELTPNEDRGAFFVRVVAPEGAGFDYTMSKMLEVEARLLPLLEEGIVQRVLVRVPGFGGGVSSERFNSGTAVVNLVPWEQRSITTDELVERVRRDLDQIPGIRAIPTVRRGLGRGGGAPVQLVLGGPTYEQLVEWRDRLMQAIEQRLPGLTNLDSDFKETEPQLHVTIDRARAADLGVSVEEIGLTLDALMGGRRATRFVMDGEEYDVIVQAPGETRATPQALARYFVRSQRSGELVPLANLVNVREIAEPSQYNRFNRMRAITISANLAPGYRLGEAIEDLTALAREVLPGSAQLDWAGESREYLRAGREVVFTFALALLIVFLVLAAQFESFLHPLTIMLTVPLAVLGALLGLYLAGDTLNLYSQIGIVMLIGLAAKNGVLIVEFANQLRDRGLSVRAAILQASAIRLRPIVMTSLATVMGALPLLLATGAGSASRATIGLVIVSGVLFSTLLTLFVVPTFYAVLAPFTRSPGAVARELEEAARRRPEEVAKDPA
ncbi:MAG: multidrug transporter [Lysobacterales bacterium]|jgi:multidrug efflux pump|nr:MAG: multidrug transporter [Xanthomonadales bacterium]